MLRKRLAMFLSLAMFATSIPMPPVSVLAEEIDVVSEDGEDDDVLEFSSDSSEESEDVTEDTIDEFSEDEFSEDDFSEDESLENFGEDSESFEEIDLEDSLLEEAEVLFADEDSVLLDQEYSYTFAGVELPDQMNIGEEFTIEPVVEKFYEDEGNQIHNSNAQGEIQLKFEYDDSAFVVKNEQGEVVPSDESIGYTEGAPYTIMRIASYDTQLNIVAERWNDDAEEMDQLCRSEFFFDWLDYELYFDGLREGGYTYLYDTENCSVSLHTDLLDDSQKGFTVAWELLRFDWDDETGESYTPVDYKLDTEDNGKTVILNASSLKDVLDFDNYYYRIGAVIFYGEHFVIANEFGFDIRDAREEYYYEYDFIKTVRNRDFYLNGEFDGYIQNEEFAYGNPISCSITDVEIENGSSDTCYVEAEEDGYRIYAVSEGEYDAVVYFSGYQGKELTYQFHISVRGDVLHLDRQYPNRSDQMLPNSEMEISTSLNYEWRYEDGYEGGECIENYSIEILEENGEPCYDTNLINAVVEEDGKTLKITSFDQFGGTNIPVHITAIAREGREDEFEIDDYEDIWVCVSDCYTFFDSESIEVDDNLKLNDSCTISPKVMEAFTDQGESIVREMEGTIRYRIGTDDFDGAIEITDQNGNPVENWGAADCGSYEYTIKRLCPYNGRVTVIAERLREDGNENVDEDWEEVRRDDLWLNELWYDIEFDGLIEDGFICVFEDEIRAISVLSDIFYDYNDVEVKWELYGLDRETEADDSRYDLSEYWKSGPATDYEFDGKNVKQYTDWDRTILRMRAAVCVDGYELGSREFTIDYYEKENNYNVEDWDIAMVPRSDRWIYGEISGWVRDQYNPFGTEVYVPVTNVTVANSNGSRIPRVCSVYQEGDSFRIVANNFGDADVTVYYLDYYGHESSYSFTVHVDADVLYLDVYYPDDTDCMLTNTTKEIGTSLMHQWYYSDDEQGCEMIEDYTINIGEDEEGNPFYDPNMIDASVLEDGKTLRVDAKDHYGDTYININTEVQMDYGNEIVPLFTGNDVRINIVEGYSYFEEFEYDADAKVGETVEFYPIIKNTRIDNGEVIVEDVNENIHFEVEYQEDEFDVTVDESCISVTRKKDYDLGLNILCIYKDEYDEYEICRSWVTFNEVDHDWVISYTWSADSSKCYAMAYCENDLEVQFESVYVEKTRKTPATCTADEVISCLATFDNDLFETQKKEIKGTKALGHKYVNNKCSRCGTYEKLAAPTLSKIENVSNGVKITWKAVKNAKLYYVYRKYGSGGWSKIGSATTTSYTDKTAALGKKYSYTVRCIANDGSKKAISSYNTTGLAITRLAAITPTLANSGSTIKISWKKTAGATGYVIYRKAGSGKYAKLATISKNSTISYTDKSVKKGTTYTYYVYAYTGKVTGAYVAKSIKKN